MKDGIIKTLLLVILWIGVSVMVAILINDIFTWFRKRKMKRVNSLMYFRTKKIENVLFRLHRTSVFRKNSIDDKELIQMIHDYSMTSINYNAAIRNLKRIEELGKTEEVRQVAARARDVLRERFAR